MSGTAHRAGFVTIAGLPNAGKSTLLNALVGEKIAITARQAQTTRTAIQGVLTMPDAQMIFVDTPGIHKSDTLLNKRMMQTVRQALDGRELVLYVADATRAVGEEDEHALSALGRSGKTLLVLSKIDRVDDKRRLLPLGSSASPPGRSAAAVGIVVSTDVLDDEAVGISLVDPTKQDADGEAGPLDEPSTSPRRRNGREGRGIFGES